MGASTQIAENPDRVMTGFGGQRSGRSRAGNGRPSHAPARAVSVRTRCRAANFPNELRVTSSVGQEHKEVANLRAIVIAIFAAAAIGSFSPSGVSAAPASGAVIGEAAAAGQMIEKARRYRRYPHRRRVPYYTYGPYDRSGAEASHQLSEENQQ